ncbi:hypothetical protein MRB53_040513 [Persea americana]|nr:hypothetical protein MRB53_040513 [Persea americana]
MWLTNTGLANFASEIASSHDGLQRGAACRVRVSERRCWRPGMAWWTSEGNVLDWFHLRLSASLNAAGLQYALDSLHTRTDGPRRWPSAAESKL